MPALQNAVTCWRGRNINAWPEFSAERQSRECWGAGSGTRFSGLACLGAEPTPCTASGTGVGRAEEAQVGSGPTEAALQTPSGGPAYLLRSLSARCLRLHAPTAFPLCGPASLNTTALGLLLILSTHFILPGTRASFL